MLTSSGLLSGALGYLTALSAPGSMHAVSMPRSTEGPVAISLPLAAECRVVHFHSKPLLSKPLVSVLAARPVPLGPSNKGKRRSSSLQQRKSEKQATPLLCRRTNSASERLKPSEASPQHSLRPCVQHGSWTSTNIMDLRRSAMGSKQSPLTGNRADGRVNRMPRRSMPVLPAPPIAASTAEHLKQFDYVPSLADIKNINQKLEGVRRLDPKKLEHKREESLRHESVIVKEKIVELKKRQRQEIYALNKVMTDLEYKHFQELVETRGLNE